MDLSPSFPVLGLLQDPSKVIQKIKCIFCSRNIPDKSEESKTKAQILRNKFRKLCAIFKIEFPGKWKVWNFVRESVPFCEHCQLQITRLGQFHDELEVIQREIRSIIASLTTELVVYEGKFVDVDRTEDDNSEGRGQAPNAKHEYFRRKIYKGFSPHVVIQDCRKKTRKRRKNVNATLRSKSTTSAASHKTTKDGIEVIDVVCEPSELITFEDHLEEPDDDYTPAEDALDDYPSDEEDSNWNELSGIVGTDSNSETEAIQDLSTSKADPVDNKKRKRKTRSTKIKTVPNKPSTSTSVTDELIPQVSRTKDLEHVKDNQYVYMGIPFSKEEKNVFKCLSCDFYADGSRLQDKFLRIKLHIRKIHRTIKPPKPALTAGRVELIDPVTQTYRYDGYQFTFSEADNNYVCGTCLKTSRVNHGKRQKWLNIQKHIDIFHKQVWSGRCELCGTEHSNLVAHRQYKHNTSTHSRVCHKCGKEFKTALLLGNHMYAVHRDKSYTCCECHQHFKTKKALEYHMRRHTLEKPYVCEVCGQCFSRTGTLNIHFATKHGERKFPCPICERSFAANFQLTRHIKEVHEGIKPPPSKRRPKEKKQPPNFNVVPVPDELSVFFPF